MIWGTESDGQESAAAQLHLSRYPVYFDCLLLHRLSFPLVSVAFLGGHTDDSRRVRCSGWWQERLRLASLVFAASTKVNINLTQLCYAAGFVV